MLERRTAFFFDVRPFAAPFLFFFFAIDLAAETLVLGAALRERARFFNAVRDTVTDKFIMTYKAGEPKPSKLPKNSNEVVAK